MKDRTFNISGFREIVEEIKQANKGLRAEAIGRLLSFDGLIRHYKNKDTRRSVFAASQAFEYPHEYHTAKKLAAVNYDVVLVPEGYFTRYQKKFDVFLARDYVLLEADLKCITTVSARTLAKRIKEGSEQASRVVLDITSPIQKNILIDGLKEGCERNEQLVEVMLFYNSKFYRFPKDEVLSKNVWKIFK